MISMFPAEFAGLFVNYDEIQNRTTTVSLSEFYFCRFIGFLQSHRETERFFSTSGVEHDHHNQDLFNDSVSTTLLSSPSSNRAELTDVLVSWRKEPTS